MYACSSKYYIRVVCFAVTQSSRRLLSGAESSPAQIFSWTRPVVLTNVQLIGAFGFTLCGSLGLAYDTSGAQYEASLATFWGAWAFLSGSLIQWYESLDKYPVIERSKHLT